MSIESIKYIETEECDVCKQIVPTLEIEVVIPCGWENTSGIINICKRCFDINYPTK